MSTIQFFIQISFNLVCFVCIWWFFFYPFQWQNPLNSQLLVLAHESCSHILRPIIALKAREQQFLWFLCTIINVLSLFFPPFVLIGFWSVDLVNKRFSYGLVVSACCKFSAFRISNRIHTKNTKHTSRIRGTRIRKNFCFLRQMRLSLLMRRFIIILLNSLFIPCNRFQCIAHCTSTRSTRSTMPFKSVDWITILNEKIKRWHFHENKWKQK